MAKIVLMWPKTIDREHTYNSYNTTLDYDNDTLGKRIIQSFFVKNEASTLKVIRCTGNL